MTQTGEMLGIMGPQTMLISWGTGLLDGAAAATPGSHDVTRGEAIRNTQNALLEVATPQQMKCMPWMQGQGLPIMIYIVMARNLYEWFHGVRKERCCRTFFGDMTEVIWTQSLRERCSIR